MLNHFAVSRKLRFVATVCVVLLAVCPFVIGQATGSFSGTVSDSSGAVLNGVTVTITAQATNISREAKTDDSGHFLVPLLGPGIYMVHVQAAGFKPAEQKDLRLQIDEQREVDFKLIPASVSTTVEVSASEVAVQTTNATLGQVITAEQVAELPLNGRDFVQLATLTPGTTQETNPNSFFNAGPSSEVSARGTYSLSVGGSRAQSTDWLLDGNDNNELTAGGISILPSIDAIQEFKVLTYNYSAEWGTRAGPTVLVTTKSGSNKFHGSLFEFFRNTSLDAKSYFASSKDKFNLNQFGGSLGGALKKDKTFFFLDYQAKRQRRGIPELGFVPTPAMIGGDFTLEPTGATRPLGTVGLPPVTGSLINPYTGTNFYCDNSGNAVASVGGVQTPTANLCNKIPTDMFDGVGANLLALYPAANILPANAAFGNFSNVPVRKLNEGEFDVRLDHNFSAKDSLFARFSYDQAVSFVPGGSPGFAEANAFASTQNITNHGRNAAISETHIFSDRTINQFNAGFNRIFNHILSFGDKSCESAKLGINGGNLNPVCPGAPAGLVSQSKKDCISCGLTSTQLTGYWGLGDRGFAPFQGGTNVFSVSDSFDMIRGKHNVRVGLGFRDQQMNVETNAFQDGFYLLFGGYTGDAAADLLTGQLGGAIHDQTFFGATTGRRWKLYRPFVQDDWRVSNDLTLNLGLAWAFVTPITEAQNRQANFNFATGQLLVAGNAPTTGCTICVHSGPTAGIKMDKTALEPRISIAWKPMGSQTTAIRLGYAIFHDSSWNQGAQGLWENPPYLAESDNFNFSAGNPCPYGNAKAAVPAPCGTSNAFLPIITTPQTPFGFPGTLLSQNLNFKQGLVQQLNLNVERQVAGGVVLTAGYAGSRSSRILVDGMNQNTSSPQACFQLIPNPVVGQPPIANPEYNPNYTLGCGKLAPTAVYGNAPYGPFQVVAATSDTGSARYDSLQIKAETKNARHGLYALIGYTYARNFDSGFNDGVGTAAGATYWPLPGTKHADWGLSQLNVNHTFTASATYALPFGTGKRFGGNWSSAANAVFGGWEVDVIERVLSGFPVFLINSNNGSGVNLTNNGNNYNRPDQTCSGALSHPTALQWFNTTCFTSAAGGELGNAARAPVYGPRFANTDISAIKHFRLPYEGVGLDFRAEFFNLLNHTNFASPTPDVSSPSFGTINQSLDPRVIQLALKLNF